jgi:PEP-CTERM motif
MKLKLTAAALALAASSMANAGAIVIDDFGLGQTAATWPSGASTSSVAATYFSSRTLQITATNEQANIKVDGTSGTNPAVAGLLAISNDSGVSSTANVSWALNMSAIMAAIGDAGNFTWTLSKVYLDQGSVTVGGSARGSTPTPETITIATGMANPFAISFASTVDTDSRWDNLTLNYTCNTGSTEVNGKCTPPVSVPVPGSLALLGFGLLGFGAIRRKA